MPYFFASLKVAVAASLVGTIVGELPTGAIEGLGARMLIGSQFGEPLIMWAALFAAAILAGLLIVAVGWSSGWRASGWGCRHECAWHRCPCRLAGALGAERGGWRVPRGAAVSGKALVPVLFGVALLVLWEGLVRGLGGVFRSSCRRPAAIAATFAASTRCCGQISRRPILKGAVSGFLIGAGAAFVAAIAIDRARSCSAAFCRWAISSPRCRSSASRRSW
jgi:ABC-type nitrate/sulfonate/bicarbonate transport system permease component